MRFCSYPNQGYSSSPGHWLRSFAPPTTKSRETKSLGTYASRGKSFRQPQKLDSCNEYIDIGRSQQAKLSCAHSADNKILWAIAIGRDSRGRLPLRKTCFQIPRESSGNLPCYAYTTYSSYLTQVNTPYYSISFIQELIKLLLKLTNFRPPEVFPGGG